MCKFYWVSERKKKKKNVLPSSSKNEKKKKVINWKYLLLKHSVQPVWKACILATRLKQHLPQKDHRIQYTLIIHSCYWFENFGHLKELGLVTQRFCSVLFYFNSEEQKEMKINSFVCRYVFCCFFILDACTWF